MTLRAGGSGHRRWMHTILEILLVNQEDINVIDNKYICQVYANYKMSVYFKNCFYFIDPTKR